MVVHSTAKQPSRVSTLPNLVTSSLLSLDCLAELWNWESKTPAAKDIWQMYEVQCQLFFVVTGLKRNEWIDHNRFSKSVATMCRVGSRKFICGNSGTKTT
jgi:hypothetical protein